MCGINRRILLVYWLPLGGWMATIFISSTLPRTQIESIAAAALPFQSETLHVAEYLILGVLLYRVVALIRMTQSLIWLAVLVVGIGYALTDEFHQSFVPGRDANWYDVTFDSLGVVIGLAAVDIGYRLMDRPEVFGRSSRTRSDCEHIDDPDQRSI